MWKWTANLDPPDWTFLGTVLAVGVFKGLSSNCWTPQIVQHLHSLANCQLSRPLTAQQLFTTALKKSLFAAKTPQQLQSTSAQLSSQVYHLAQHPNVHKAAVCYYRQLGLHAAINFGLGHSATSKIESWRSQVGAEPCFHSKSKILG